jgi:hypothetical protein
MIRIFITAFLIVSASLSAQDIDFVQLSKLPKDTSISIPLDYKIARLSLTYPQWDRDYEAYHRFLNHKLYKMQGFIELNEKGVRINMTPNSISPHAQLDTSTLVTDPSKFIGTWRMVKFRSIRFNDSMDIKSKKYYRLPDVLLDDKSADETFAIITEKHFKVYAKEFGKKDFKKVVSGKYVIENNRFILMYKLAKTGGGVSQIGIDDKGYMIINYSKVVEHVKPNKYFSYYAIMDQYIYERVQ